MSRCWRAVRLLLNGKTIGRYRNRPVTVVILLITLAFFLIAGFYQVKARWS